MIAIRWTALSCQAPAVFSFHSTAALYWSESILNKHRMHEGTKIMQWPLPLACDDVSP